jgi:hypothetical protein
MYRRHLYDRTDGPAWQQRPSKHVRRSLTIPENTLPIVRVLMGIMKANGIPYDHVAIASGLTRAQIKSWRKRSVPLMTNIEAALNSVGWHLIPVPRVEALPSEIASDAAALAAKMRAELPDLWGALLDLAADQAFLRERARERIEAREAEALRRRDATNTTKRRNRKPANDNCEQPDAIAI